MKDIVQLLKIVPYFTETPESELEAYAEKARIFPLERGEVLIREGEMGDSIYIVLDGRLRTSAMKMRKGEVILGEIGKGEVVGETAALMQKPRGGTVRAMRRSLLMEIKGEELIGLIQRSNETMLHFSQTILQRSQANFAYQKNQKSLLLVPLSPDIDMAAFTQSLKHELERYGTVARSTLADTPPAIDPRDPPRMSSHLATLESQHDLVVYQADREWNAWTAACARRADRVLLVGKWDGNAGMGKSEQQLQEELKATNEAQVELVILHPSDRQKPRNTKRWYEGRGLDRHHHVVENSQEHMQKLARFLTGNSIGFALSGGGFKAAMQGGILFGMQEAGIPMDILGGSSGGAFAGATFAMGHSLDEFPRMVANSMEQFRKTTKMTLPLMSLFTGKYITRAFRETFQDLDIEDLWNQYFSMSLNLVNGEVIPHRRGPLWEAIRASCSVMALFPPVVKENECLVDGGFINPCPTDVLHRMGAGKIVVVSAFGPAGVSVDALFPPDVGGWSILWKKINPFYRKKITPTIGSSIIQSMLLASDHLLRGIFSQSEIDLFIEPDFSGFNAQDNSQVQKMFELGVKHAREHAAEWKETLGV